MEEQTENPEQRKQVEELKSEIIKKALDEIKKPTEKLIRIYRRCPFCHHNIMVRKARIERPEDAVFRCERCGRLI